MTVTATDLGLYAVAVAILFLTPGPVWVALLARALSGGFRSAWPLALGVVVGDAIWPFLAIIGVTWIVSVYAGFLTVLKGVAVAFFIGMGIMIMRNADKEINQDNRLTRPGMWAGFVAGLAVILGNPKAILFYMGMLPGFFDLSTITAPDIVAIMAVSMVVPLIGNLLLAAFVERLRRLLSTPQAVRRMNVSAGIMLIAVGLIIPFT
ncbi:MAG: LysE family translocator [Pseudomonadota bacterium]